MWKWYSSCLLTTYKSFLPYVVVNVYIIYFWVIELCIMYHSIWLQSKYVYMFIQYVGIGYILLLLLVLLLLNKIMECTKETGYQRCIPEK